MLMYTIPTTDPLGPFGLRIHDLITRPTTPNRHPATQAFPQHDFLVLAPCPALTADLLHQPAGVAATAFGCGE